MRSVSYTHLYNLTDEFVATPEYDTLYTELTGTVVLLIEANQLPMIGDVSALESVSYTHLDVYKRQG